MSTGDSAGELGRRWIAAWIEMDMDWLRGHLADDFVHVSPFGRLEGREFYLATVEPMARKSVQELLVKHVIEQGNRAAVWFENRTPRGVVESCDWLLVQDGLIQQVVSFYDPAKIREVLSPTEQRSLDGSDEKR